jgi:HlyD family secretion protein
MNKHVPPPVDDKARSADPGGVAGLTEPPPETKSPQPPPQPEPLGPPTPQPADAAQTYEPPTEENNPLRRAFWTGKRIGIVGIAIAVALALLMWWPKGGSGPKISYRFTNATIGDVAVRVNSTAVMEPRNAAEVTAQTGGRVGSVLVKSGQRVAKGQTLVHLISESAGDELTSAQAELAARQSDLARSQADLMEARATVARLRSAPKPGVMPGAIDAAEARLARVVANDNQARELLRAGEDGVVAARASLENLDVRAPTDGVVLKTNVTPQGDVRAVTRGQSVVTFAGDMSQLNLRADFPESALGRLHQGARAEFTTPAFAGRTFAATLTALDIWPKRESRDGRQFVTYGAMLTAPNADGALRPGMSANVAVVVAEARNVLLVPNAALAFVPPPKVEAEFGAVKVASGPPGARHGRVWVLQGTSPEPRDVTLGLGNGRVTQITGGSLRAGEKIITSALIAAGT